MGTTGVRVTIETTDIDDLWQAHERLAAERVSFDGTFQRVFAEGAALYRWQGVMFLCGKDTRERGE